MRCQHYFFKKSDERKSGDTKKEKKTEHTRIVWKKIRKKNKISAVCAGSLIAHSHDSNKNK